VRLFVDGVGRVGVGSPAVVGYDLNIAGSAVRINNGTNTDAYLYFGPVRAAGDYSYINWNNTAGSELLTLHTDNGGIRFNTTNVERLRIDPSGRLLVGASIATAGSAAKLQCATTVNINTTVYADNTAAKAGGLVAGDIYRKADGTLMITF
jgi:hypothetical protein